MHVLPRRRPSCIDCAYLSTQRGNVNNAIVTMQLTALIATWERLTERPERIIGARTLYHDVLLVDAMLADIPASQKAPRGHQIEIITNLYTALTRRDAATSVLEQYYLKEFERLKSVTKQPPDGYDVPALRAALTALLEVVHQPAYLARICQELAQTCLSPASDVPERLETLVQMFLERAITTLSAKRLKSYCADTLASSFLLLERDRKLFSRMQTIK